MGRFDERALRMRKERIDLYGDNSSIVVISRPERRAMTYREAVPGLAADIAKANPPVLCFDVKCPNEVRALSVFMFVSTDPEAAPMGMAACEACSKKSNEDILNILRTEFASEFGISPAKFSDQNSAPFEEMLTLRDVHGMKLGVVGQMGQECVVADAFATLLYKRKLPRFVFAFRGHNNCFAITQQLYLDLKDIGVERHWKRKEGFSSVLQGDGKPIGLHRWFECEGWAIDGSGGAFGNPVLFQRVDDYRSKRAMTDIRDVEEAPGA